MNGKSKRDEIYYNTTNVYYKKNEAMKIQRIEKII
jgi:hypothetical protein